MKNEKGFTITELLILWLFLAIIGMVGFGFYAIAHFIIKYW